MSGIQKLEIATILDGEGEIPAELMWWPWKITKYFLNLHLTRLITPTFSNRSQNECMFNIFLHGGTVYLLNFLQWRISIWSSAENWTSSEWVRFLTKNKVLFQVVGIIMSIASGSASLDNCETINWNFACWGVISLNSYSESNLSNRRLVWFGFMAYQPL